MSTATTERYLAPHNVHSSWVDYPEFQILTNVKTGERWGRFYVPAAYLAKNGDRFAKWMEQPHINIDPRDLKQYDDGSFRLCFRSTEREYARCAKYYPKPQLWAR